MRHPIAVVAAFLLTGCGSTGPPDRPVSVEGFVYLDGRPLSGVSVALVSRTQVRVPDTSIQGYHYEAVDTRIDSDRTSDGLYRLEGTVPGCSNDLIVQADWQHVAQETRLPLGCDHHTWDFWISVDTISGTVRVDDNPAAGATVEIRGGCSVFAMNCVTVMGTAQTNADGWFGLTWAGCELREAYALEVETASGLTADTPILSCLASRTVDFDLHTPGPGGEQGPVPH